MSFNMLHLSNNGKNICFTLKSRNGSAPALTCEVAAEHWDKNGKLWTLTTEFEDKCKEFKSIADWMKILDEGFGTPLSGDERFILAKFLRCVYFTSQDSYYNRYELIGLTQVLDKFVGVRKSMLDLIRGNKKKFPKDCYMLGSEKALFFGDDQVFFVSHFQQWVGIQCEREDVKFLNSVQESVFTRSRVMTKVRDGIEFGGSVYK